MIENITKKISICFICGLLVFACICALLFTQFADRAQLERHKADAILENYSETMQSNLTKGYSTIMMQLENALIQGDYSPAAVSPVAQKLVVQEQYDAIMILEDRKVSKFYGRQAEATVPVGTQIEKLNFAHSIALLTEKLVVEGPFYDTALEKDVFYIVQPIFQQGNYWGEISITIDAPKVIASFGLDTLQQIGYDYELWRVDPITGAKQIIMVTNPEANFSNSQEIKFEMPSVWTLSLRPQRGWIVAMTIYTAVALNLILSFLSSLAVWQILCKRDLHKKLIEQINTDPETGLKDKEGLLTEVTTQIKKSHPEPFFIMYACLKNYSRIASRLSSTQKHNYLQTIIETINRYINGNHLIFRTSEDSFSILLYGEYEPVELQHMEKGLAVELLQKITAEERTLFLTAGCGTASYPVDGTDADGLLLTAIANYDKQFPTITPLYNLTEKCNELMEDDRQIIFEDYPDEQVNALAKSIYRYYQKMQRIIFLDNDFDVGNRLGYQRDFGRLISYDNKRGLTLFLIDICEFGKYNKQFSTHTGDEILRSVIKILADIFGNHLFRINGDVLLGISLNKQTIGGTLARIETALTDSIEVEDHKLRIKYKIGICEYPSQGENAADLLGKLQTALRDAKNDLDNCYKIYSNDQ